MLTQGQMEWVRKWRKENGGHFANPKAHALKVLEECIELCVAAGAEHNEIISLAHNELMKERTRNPYEVFQINNVEEEIADILLCLAALVIEAKIDTYAAIDSKIPIIEQRKWTPDKNGVLRRSRNV